MSPDIDVVYSILREWAGRGEPRTYADLSREYQSRTGDWLEPHGNWDGPLGDINRILAAKSAPALSALVILQDRNEPGGGFWGCANNVPSRPSSESERIREWNRILKDVIGHKWPRSL